MIQYEYEYKIVEIGRVFDSLSEDRLNELGKEGWELIVYTSEKTSLGIKPKMKLIFKRAINLKSTNH